LSKRLSKRVQHWICRDAI